MEKGPESFQHERSVLNDERTGREVWKVSPDGANCVAAYMYIRSFTADERYLFYASDRTGSVQLYRCELATGQTTRLTDAADLAWHNANIHPVTEEVFYRDGGIYRAVHMQTLESRQVLDTTELDWLAQPDEQVSFSATGKYFSLGYQAADGRAGIARARSDGAGAENIYIRPEGGTQHLLFANADDDLMSFAVHPDWQQEWDGDDARRARAWLLNAATGEAEPLLVMAPPCTATHEHWGPTGDRLYYHKKTRPAWTPTWICALDRHTREHRTIFGSDSIKLGHSCINHDETKIVTDSQEPGHNELILVDVATGAGEVLCWPDSTVGDGQVGHVHPSFSPTGRYVLYTSDVTGEAQVYVVPLG